MRETPKDLHTSIWKKFINAKFIYNRLKRLYHFRGLVLGHNQGNKYY